MQNQTSTTVTNGNATVSTAIAKPWQLVAAFLLGAVIIYGAGFADTAHNTAHDMRHSQGFPCH